MKIKKLLLIILLFFFCLLISNNVNAFVVSEGGIENFYLPDLPNNSDNNVMFFNEDSLNVTLFSFPENYYLGYDRINNRFTLFNSDKEICPVEEISVFNIYYANVTLSDGKYICGGNWNNYSYTSTSVSLANIDYTKLKFIYGTSNIYPCYNDILVLNLPFGKEWSDDLIIAYDYNGGKKIFAIIPDNQIDSYVWSKFNANNNYASYRDFYNSTNSVSLSAYEYNSDIDEWEYYTPKNSPSYSTNFYPVMLTYNEFIYFNKDILNCSDGSILYEGMKDLFCGFYTYSSFPYILNSQEDLAKGEEDIIIMPRRF